MGQKREGCGSDSYVNYSVLPSLLTTEPPLPWIKEKLGEDKSCHGVHTSSLLKESRFKCTCHSNSTVYMYGKILVIVCIIVKDD